MEARPHSPLQEADHLVSDLNQAVKRMSGDQAKRWEGLRLDFAVLVRSARFTNPSPDAYLRALRAAREAPAGSADHVIVNAVAHALGVEL